MFEFITILRSTIERKKLLFSRILKAIMSEGPINLVCRAPTLIAPPSAIGKGPLIEMAVLRIVLEITNFY